MVYGIRRSKILPRVLQMFEFALGPGERPLEAALRLPHAIKKRHLDLRGSGAAEDICFAGFHADQFPLRDGHLLDVELFGSGLRPPLDFEIAAEFLKAEVILAGQDDGAGAEPIAKRVQPHGGFPLRSFRAARLKRIAAICFDLLRSCH